MTTSAKQEAPQTIRAETTAFAPDSGLCGKARGRQTFVLGIFPEVAQAEWAIGRFAASQARDCDVLLVSSTRPPRRAAPPPPAAVSTPAERISWCQSDAFLKAGEKGCCTRTPESFSALWKSIHAENGADARIAPLGTQRLFQYIVKRLSEGATLLVARTENSEQRMAASHALLDANCEVLLTHDMIAPVC